MRVLEEDILPSRNCPALAERLNAHLPEDIRVLSAVQATKTFSARHACVTRQYDYFIPQQALSTLASTQGVGTYVRLWVLFHCTALARSLQWAGGGGGRRVAWGLQLTAWWRCDAGMARFPAQTPSQQP